MAILLYQIGIFLAIQIASLFGKSSRNTAIILISIFTLLQVYMSWLLILQFITIFVAYNYSNNLFFSKKTTDPQKSRKKQPNSLYYSYRTKNGGRVVTEIDLNDENLDEKTRERAILQNQIQRESTNRYENDLKYKNTIDNFIKTTISSDKIQNPTPRNIITLDTMFYIVSRAKTHGPFPAKKVISLVKKNSINRNCYIRQISEKEYKMRAYELLEILK